MTTEGFGTERRRMSDEQQMKGHYERNLKAKEYNEKFNRIFNQIRGNFEFILQFLHDVIKSGK